MSDERRDAVAKALYALDKSRSLDVCEPEYYRDQADSAIAAIDAAEPTDAEVEAAASDLCADDSDTGFVAEAWDMAGPGEKDWYRRRAKRALIAARKARP